MNKGEKVVSREEVMIAVKKIINQNPIIFLKEHSIILKESISGYSPEKPHSVEHNKFIMSYFKDFGIDPEKVITGFDESGKSYIQPTKEGEKIYVSGKDCLDIIVDVIIENNKTKS